MNKCGTRSGVLARTAIVAAATLVGGCATLGYYAHSVNGHLQLMSMRTPVDQLIASERTGEELRRRLQKALAIREFAQRELDLPDNGSYRSYVDLDRPYVSWTVVAAPELSLEAKVWCFPVIGCVAYRGYFREADAERYAADLAATSYDVVVTGVQAYSTLGWFDDPLLDTMIRQPEYRLAGLIFHELAHQRVYAKNDSAFNEAYAVVVERAGVSRWLERSGDPELSARYAEDQKRHADFLVLLGNARRSLERVYASALTNEAKRAEKAAVFHRLRADYRALRRSWNGYAGYDQWFESDLNNAKLALIATYNAYVPALRSLLHQEGGDLAAFNKACEVLAKMPFKDRESALERLHSVSSAQRT
ncbi:MAG TPA: aminopeptidase [Gammaproteobacteria bacterium]|nr:aminopeptidase [Gammaproteobacteria bacterium]